MVPRDANRPGTFRRSRFSPVLLLALLAAGCGGGATPRADLVLLGGRIVTLDPGRPEARALAVAAGEILAVGEEDEIRRHLGPGTEVIDLGGRLVLPGFIESHGHFRALGRFRAGLDLSDARAWEEILARVRAAVEGAPPGQWIEGRGWHQEKWDSLPAGSVEGVPTHAGLSALSPRNPVFLEHASGHAAFANRLALERAGVGRDTPDPPGGVYVRDPSGEPTGLLREGAADAVAAAMERDRAARTPEEREAELRAWVERAGRELLAHGVTTIHDAGATFAEVDAYRRLAEQGALPVRLYVLLWATNEELEERLAEVRVLGAGNGHLTVRGIKKQLDGALGSHGAWLLEPYADMPETSGIVLQPLEEIRRAAELALAHDYQLAVHAIGDRANRELLDLYESVFAGRPRADLRWRIEHAQHVQPEDVPRFARLGVIASVQTIHGCSDAPWVPTRLGPERAAATGYPWRDLWDSGAVVVNGTDVPVEPVDPIANLRCAIERRSREGRSFFDGQTDQRLSPLEAARSYTYNAAYAGFEERRKGSLAPGKLADIVVLSEDILALPAAETRDAHVDFTIVGGEIRYRAEGAPDATLASGGAGR